MTAGGWAVSAWFPAPWQTLPPLCSFLVPSEGVTREGYRQAGRTGEGTWKKGRCEVAVPVFPAAPNLTAVGCLGCSGWACSPLNCNKTINKIGLTSGVMVLHTAWVGPGGLWVGNT